MAYNADDFGALDRIIAADNEFEFLNTPTRTGSAMYPRATVLADLTATNAQGRRIDPAYEVINYAERDGRSSAYLRYGSGGYVKIQVSCATGRVVALAWEAFG